MAAKFLWFTKIWSFSNDDGNENSKKNSIRLTLAKQQLCTCITLFCTFPSRRYTTATWHFKFQEPALYGVSENKNFSPSFSKLRYGPFGFSPSNFADIWQIKWIWIRWMMIKFELVRIHFLSDVLISVCCDPGMLLAW